MITKIIRWFLSLFRALFRTARKPFRPTFNKPGEWKRLVQSFHIDRLPKDQKAAAFRMIMSFRQ